MMNHSVAPIPCPCGSTTTSNHGRTMLSLLSLNQQPPQRRERYRICDTASVVRVAVLLLVSLVTRTAAHVGVPLDVHARQQAATTTRRFLRTRRLEHAPDEEEVEYHRLLQDSINNSDTDNNVVSSACPKDAYQSIQHCNDPLKLLQNDVACDVETCEWQMDSLSSSNTTPPRFCQYVTLSSYATEIASNTLPDVLEPCLLWEMEYQNYTIPTTTTTLSPSDVMELITTETSATSTSRNEQEDTIDNTNDNTIDNTNDNNIDDAIGVPVTFKPVVMNFYLKSPTVVKLDIEIVQRVTYLHLTKHIRTYELDGDSSLLYDIMNLTFTPLETYINEFAQNNTILQSYSMSGTVLFAPEYTTPRVHVVNTMVQNAFRQTFQSTSSSSETTLAASLSWYNPNEQYVSVLQISRDPALRRTYAVHAGPTADLLNRTDSNAANNSTTATTNTTTKPNTNKEPLLQWGNWNDPIMIAIIAGGAAALIGFLLVTCLICYQQKQRRRGLRALQHGKGTTSAEESSSSEEVNAPPQEGDGVVDTADTTTKQKKRQSNKNVSNQKDHGKTNKDNYKTNKDYAKKCKEKDKKSKDMKKTTTTTSKNGKSATKITTSPPPTKSTEAATAVVATSTTTAVDQNQNTRASRFSRSKRSAGGPASITHSTSTQPKSNTTTTLQAKQSKKKNQSKEKMDSNVDGTNQMVVVGIADDSDSHNNDTSLSLQEHSLQFICTTGLYDIEETSNSGVSDNATSGGDGNGGLRNTHAHYDMAPSDVSSVYSYLDTNTLHSMIQDAEYSVTEAYNPKGGYYDDYVVDVDDDDNTRDGAWSVTDGQGSLLSGGGYDTNSLVGNRKLRSTPTECRSPDPLSIRATDDVVLYPSPAIFELDSKSLPNGGTVDGNNTDGSVNSNDDDINNTSGTNNDNDTISTFGNDTTTRNHDAEDENKKMNSKNPTTIIENLNISPQKKDPPEGPSEEVNGGSSSHSKKAFIMPEQMIVTTKPRRPYRESDTNPKNYIPNGTQYGEGFVYDDPNTNDDDDDDYYDDNESLISRLAPPSVLMNNTINNNDNTFIHDDDDDDDQKTIDTTPTVDDEAAMQNKSTTTTSSSIAPPAPNDDNVTTKCLVENGSEDARYHTLEDNLALSPIKKSIRTSSEQDDRDGNSPTASVTNSSSDDANETNTEESGIGKSYIVRSSSPLNLSNNDSSFDESNSNSYQKLVTTAYPTASVAASSKGSVTSDPNPSNRGSAASSVQSEDGSGSEPSAEIIRATVAERRITASALAVSVRKSRNTSLFTRSHGSNSNLGSVNEQVTSTTTTTTKEPVTKPDVDPIEIDYDLEEDDDDEDDKIESVRRYLKHTAPLAQQAASKSRTSRRQFYAHNTNNSNNENIINQNGNNNNNNSKTVDPYGNNNHYAFGSFLNKSNDVDASESDIQSVDDDQRSVFSMSSRSQSLVDTPIKYNNGDTKDGTPKDEFRFGPLPRGGAVLTDQERKHLGLMKSPTKQNNNRSIDSYALDTDDDDEFDNDGDGTSILLPTAYNKNNTLVNTNTNASNDGGVLENTYFSMLIDTSNSRNNNGGDATDDDDLSSTAGSEAGLKRTKYPVNSMASF